MLTTRLRSIQKYIKFLNKTKLRNDEKINVQILAKRFSICELKNTGFVGLSRVFLTKSIRKSQR